MPAPRNYPDELREETGIKTGTIARVADRLEPTNPASTKPGAVQNFVPSFARTQMPSTCLCPSRRRCGRPGCGPGDRSAPSSRRRTANGKPPTNREDHDLRLEY